MNRPAAVAIAAVGFVVGTCSPSPEQNNPHIRLEPGLWSVKMKMTQDGSPVGEATQSHCYTEAEFDDPMHTFAPADQNKPCTVKHSVTGRTLRVTSTCKLPDGTTELTQDITWVFEDTRHFTQSTRTVSTGPTEKTELMVTADFRLTGPCPK
jgi:uncharacterized protein DUF3617